jgi:DNA-binding beta-propeller fold protein YncE
MATNPQGDRILVCTGDFGGLYSYQLDTNTFSPPLSTVVGPYEYANFTVFSPDGSHYCVVLENGGLLKVVDAVQNQVIGTMVLPVHIRDFGEGIPVVVAPDGINFFAILSDNTIAWIKLNTMEIFRSLSIGSNAVQYYYSSLAMNPAGTYLYITGLSSENFPCLYTLQIPKSN